MRRKPGRITNVFASRTSGSTDPHSACSVRLWQQRLKSIKLRDGSFHDGQLELVTWPSRTGRKGWGGTLVEEAEDLRNKYLREMKGDDQRVRTVFLFSQRAEPLQLFKYFDSAFRWTCCGNEGGTDHGPFSTYCDPDRQAAIITE